MLEESRGAILLVATLLLALLGAIVADVLDDSEEVAQAEAIERALRPAIGMARKTVEDTRWSTQQKMEADQRAALGRLKEGAVRKALEYRQRQPDVACEPTSASNVPGVAVRFPLKVTTFEPRQFVDRTALLEYEVVVGPEAFDKPMRNVFLDRGLDCGGFDRARLTIHTKVDGTEYRRTACMQTPGGYSEELETWLLDSPSWEFVYDWDGNADAFRPDGGVWSPRRLPFPAGDARMLVEMQGERDGEPFVVTGTAPIVVLPFAPDPGDLSCKAVPPPSETNPWAGRDPAPQAKFPWPGQQ